MKFFGFHREPHSKFRYDRHSRRLLVEVLESRDNPSAPYAEAVVLDNVAPKTNDMLYAEVQNAVDWTVMRYVWKVDDVVVRDTTSTLTDAINLSISGYGECGEVIQLTVTPMAWDSQTSSYICGDPVSAESTVANTAPVFTPTADPVVNEDAGAQSFVGWAADISAEPVYVTSQVVTFVIEDNSNESLFSAGPQISAAGALTFTPAANAHGSADITIYLQDDAGGDDTSASITFTITVNAVNDAPSFSGGDDVVIDVYSGAQSLTAWARAISAGSANESAQELTFVIQSNSNPYLFIEQPTIAADGTLSFTPAPYVTGVAEIAVYAQDDGGTNNNGVNASEMQYFTITVQPFVFFEAFEFADDQGATAIITVCLTNVATDDVTVYYTTTDGTAEAGEDYTAASSSVTIPQGELSATFTISILTDENAENGETFTITLSNPTNADLDPNADEANFTIFTAPETNRVRELNQISGLVQVRLNTGDQDITSIDDWVYGTMEEIGVDGALAVLDRMADIRNDEDPPLETYQNEFDTLGLRIGEIVALADNIIRVQLTRAAEISQGIKFRVEGIRADIQDLNTKLGAVSNAIQTEINALEPTNGFFEGLEIYQARLAQRAAEGLALYNNAINAEPVEDADIDELNSLYLNMELLLVGVAARHVEIVAYDFSMSVAAAAIQANISGAEGTYALLAGNLQLAAYANCDDTITSDPNTANSAINKANAAKVVFDRAFAGDEYAFKGVNRFLDLFEFYLQAELDIVSAQKAMIENIIDPNSQIITNLNLTAQELTDSIVFLNS